MKITSASVRLLQIPVDREYEAGGRVVSAYWHVLAEVTTSDGVRGFGYDVFMQRSFMSAVLSASRELAEVLVGLDVFETEKAWERMSYAGRWIGPGGLLHYAIAPLDIAMWDAAARTAGQPVYRLMGGFRDRIEAYATDGFTYDLPVERLVENAHARIADGFRAIKMRLIGGKAKPADELRRFLAVREAVGPDIRLLAEAAQSWNLSQALEVGRALEDANVHWIEDPVYHKDFSALSEIARRLRTPIAAGENLYELGDYARLFDVKGAGIAVIDLGRIGGFTPWRKVAALAHAHALPVCGHVIPELHLQPLAAIPNGYLVEYGPRSRRILQEMPALGKRSHGRTGRARIGPEAR